MLKRLATLLLGIGLIGLGVLLFIAPERAFAVQFLTRYWPLFLILAGLVRVAGYLIDRHPRSPVGGLIITSIGGIIMAANWRGEQSIIRILGNYWFWLLLALIIGRVLRQYTHRPEEGVRPKAFSPGAIVLMLFIVGGGLAANYLSKKSEYVNNMNLGIGKFNDVRDYFLADQLSVEDEPAQTFALHPNSRLVVNNLTGDLEITAAPQQQATARIIKRIRAINEEEAKQLAQNIHLQISSSGNNYQFSVNSSAIQQDFSSSIIITLPQNAEAGVEVTGNNGLVKLVGLRGEHIIRDGDRAEITDNEGRVTIENPRGEVKLRQINGEVRLDDIRNGRLNLQAIKGAVVVSAQRSRIDVEDIDGDLSVASTNGRIVASHINGALRIKDDDGYVEVDAVKGAATVETTRDVTVRNFRGPLYVTSRSGTIRLETDGKLAADIKAVNEKGKIRVSLPQDSEFRIDALSSSGRVKVIGFDKINYTRDDRSAKLGFNISNSSPLVSLRSNYSEIQLQSGGLALAQRENE